MKIEDANKFISEGDWETAMCGNCRESLARGGGPRPTNRCRELLLGLPWSPPPADDDEVDILCHDCLYAYDVAEFRRTGVMSGGSVPTKAMMRRDLEVYAPFFDAEVVLTPTIMALWEKYKGHPTLNDPKVKRAILIDTTTGDVYSRTFGEEFHTLLKGQIAAGATVVEIFDSMCGYVGLELYRFGRADGMWIQGQVREKGAQAWYRGCHADKGFVDAVNAAVRGHVDMPFGYSLYEYGVRLPAGLFGAINLFGKELEEAPAKAWAHAEANVRAYLSTSYQLPEFQPQWVAGSGFWPREAPAS